MASRLTLQSELEGILGSRNVYFQPPESIKMNYPCIVYSLADIPTQSADNINYFIAHKYQVTLIHKDPDNTIKDILARKSKCRFSSFFTKDNLNHYVYSLYY